MAYNKGDRVELIHTNDQYTRLKPGDKGTVVRERESFGVREVSVEWDTGSTLTMLLDEGDRIKALETKGR